jgi:hypothetical protein
MPGEPALQHPPNHATCSHVMSLLPLVVVCLVALTKIVPSQYHNDSLTVVLSLPITLPIEKVFLSLYQDPFQTVGPGVMVYFALLTPVPLSIYISRANSCEMIISSLDG